MEQLHSVTVSGAVSTCKRTAPQWQEASIMARICGLFRRLHVGVSAYPPCRKHNAHHGSRALLADDGERAAVQFHQRFGERQSQTRSFEFAAEATIDLAEG